MTTDNRNLPALPWEVSTRGGMSWAIDIVDAEGKRVVTVWGYANKSQQAVINLILEASRAAAANRRLGDERP